MSKDGDSPEHSPAPEGEQEVVVKEEPVDDISAAEPTLKRDRERVETNGEDRTPSPPAKKPKTETDEPEDSNSSDIPKKKKEDKDRKEKDKDKRRDEREDRDRDDKDRRREKEKDREREKDKDKEREKDRRSRRDRSRSRSKSRSPRSRSPDAKRRREKDREKERDAKDKDAKDRDSRRRRDRDDDKDNRKRKDDAEQTGENLEDGEVAEEPPAPPPKPRELTARELERQRIINEELMNNSNADEEDEPVWSMRKAQEEKSTRQCPYLDTIDRSVLDFDFEKLCSVSLSHLNVYACMVCGKYFQGRGTNTHAYTHSLDTDHRVFLNLSTLKFYCLPDNYEVADPSLEDIKYVLKPTYSKKMTASLPLLTRMARAYDDSTYFPGVVGLNNIKANDYVNCILHALSHVAPLRDYFLRPENYENIKRPPGDRLTMLPRRFGEMLRKLWNPKAFRTHVSPHEMLQAIVICSEKKYQFIKQSDAVDFMIFFLNKLHEALNGKKSKNSSIINKIFQGRMREYTRKVIPAEATDAERNHLLQLEAYQETSREIPFMCLTLDLPPAPLYRDIQLNNIIAQVPLQTLLHKFNGTSAKEYKTYNENIMKRFELLSLPDYLIITYKRFHKNKWFVEKNSTIVNFPISNVDMYDCLTEEARAEHKYTTYDLVANVVHEGKPDTGNYRVQLVHTGSEKWFELEDLHVKEISPQMIVLAESYVQFWRLNKEKTRQERMSEGTEGMPMDS